MPPPPPPPPDFGNASAPKSSGTVCGVKYSRRTSSALTNRTSAAYFFSHCNQGRGGGEGGRAEGGRTRPLCFGAERMHASPTQREQRSAQPPDGSPVAQSPTPA